MEIQRESIFISALRTFSRLFFGVVAIFIAFILCSIVYSALSPTPLLKENTTLEILPDAKGTRELVSPTSPAILQISIKGVIGDPKGVNTEMVENILLDSREGLLRKDRVKGILLYLNSPGGTVVDSDNIYRMLTAYKEKYNIPIYAYIDGLCASGGMYIASSADQIFAGPASITGSVGVIIGPFFNVYDTLGKVGVKALTLTKGLDKDMMNPTRPWKEDEDASLKNVISFFYNQFVKVVTDNRPRIDRSQLIDVYGAQVFDCVKAETLGYIDHAMSSRDEALTALLAAAKIDPSTPYQVIELKSKRDWFSDLVQGKSPLLTGKVEHSLDLGETVIKDKVAYLYRPLE